MCLFSNSFPIFAQIGGDFPLIRKELYAQYEEDVPFFARNRDACSERCNDFVQQN